MAKTTRPRTATGSREASARNRIIAAALERFGADGALAATLDEVRRQAGVSVGALYHHFPDKSALATALYLTGLEQYQPGILKRLRDEPDARRGIEGVVRHHLRWSVRNRALARFLLFQRGSVDDAEVIRASRPFLAEAMAWYRRHAHYGIVQPLPFDVVHALWLGPSQEYLRHWLAGRARTIPQAATATLASAAWHSLEEPT